MEFFLASAEETLQSLGTSETGLTEDEAGKRLLKNGRNELVRAKTKSLFRRFADQILNPMILVLLAAAAVSIGITVFEGGGFSEYAEAGIILAVVILNSILGVVQESKAEKAIEALQEMSAATAKARRGGVVSQIPAGELTALPVQPAEDPIESAMKMPCPISKHKGKTLGDMLSIDPNAIVWVATKFTGDKTISDAAKLICDHSLAATA